MNTDKLDPRLANLVETAIDRTMQVHGVSRDVAIAMLIRSGNRRLQTARQRYRHSLKGEVAERRYERRKAKRVAKQHRRASA